MTQGIPEGYTAVTPYLIVSDADKTVAFLKATFGATEDTCLRMPGTNMIMHMGLSIYGAKLMLASACEQFPEQLGMINIYTDDVDRDYAKALEAGGTSIREPENQFYGDRNGMVKGPSGVLWGISTHIESLTDEQIEARFQEMMQQHKPE